MEKTGIVLTFTLLAVWGIALLLWAWALIDILKSEFRTSVDKVIWLLMVFFLPFVGVILYYFIGRKQKI